MQLQVSSKFRLEQSTFFIDQKSILTLTSLLNDCILVNTLFIDYKTEKLTLDQIYKEKDLNSGDHSIPTYQKHSKHRNKLNFQKSFVREFYVLRLLPQTMFK